MDSGARPPGAHEEAADGPVRGAGGDQRAAGGCILVVDDDEAIRGVVTVALAEEGYGVAVAPNGHAASERLRYHRPG
jgi:PleD family two-component response regulator